MTGTVFENKVTMGNVLTAIGLVITIAFAWSDLQARQAALERRTIDVEADASKMAMRMDGSEGRVRMLEQASATSTARYESLSQSMGEVKAELRQTNDLLRQMIKGEGR